MPDSVLNALRQKLVTYEKAGMTDHAKRVKARIAQEEKGEKKAATALPMTLSPSLVPAPATLSQPVTTPTVKKAAPKKAARKKN